MWTKKDNTSPPPGLEAQIVTLQKQVSDLALARNSFCKVIGQFFAWISILVAVALLINFRVASPENRWLLPEPFDGTRCLWFHNRSEALCAVWTVYYNDGSIHHADYLVKANALGYTDTCTKSGRVVKNHDYSEGPLGGMRINTWSCE